MMISSDEESFEEAWVSSNYTAVFSTIWFATHIHNLPYGAGGRMPGGMPPGNMTQVFHGNITGGNFPRGPPPTGIKSIPQIEYFQMAFIVLYAGLSKMISNKKKQTGRMMQTTRRQNKRFIKTRCNPSSISDC